MKSKKKTAKSSTRIVFKFADSVQIPAGGTSDVQEQFIMNSSVLSWNTFKKIFPGITLGKLFVTVPYQKLDEMMAHAKLQDPNYKSTNLHYFYWIDCPPAVDAGKLMDALSKLKTVELVYEQEDCIPSHAGNALGNPRAAQQNYLDASPAGIDAKFAWTKGGDGDGTIQLIDVEQGWFLDHEDFPLTNLGDKIISKITLLSGINKQFKGHGTEVLGVILAQDNDIGGIGITPNVKANVISIWRQLPDAKPNTADAISDALTHLVSGDVLLIELQQEKSLLPVETDIAVFKIISMGIAKGIVIIESAGNGGADLDTLKFANARGQQKKFFLKRGNAEIEQDIAFQDSGAIMVGAATSGVPHERFEGSNGSNGSNYGGRIDCYAWGNNITTTGNNGNGGTTAYTSNFGATSGASAIIAGATIAIQSMALAAGKPRYSPRQLRDILSDPDTGTSSNNPELDKIGVMPDLKKIYEKYIMPGVIPKPITPIPGTAQTAS